jgi:hypothetical protein
MVRSSKLEPLAILGPELAPPKDCNSFLHPRRLICTHRAGSQPRSATGIQSQRCSCDTIKEWHIIRWPTLVLGFTSRRASCRKEEVCLSWHHAQPGHIRVRSEGTISEGVDFSIIPFHSFDARANRRGISRHGCPGHLKRWHSSLAT